MRDYGTVSPKFWTGGTGKLLRGDAGAQVLALYLMTCPHANMIGVFHCPVLYMAHETGLGMEGASKALLRLIEAGYCTYEEDTETIFVHRMASFQVAESLKPGDNRIKGVERELSNISSDSIRAQFLAMYSVAFQLFQEQKNTDEKRPSKAPSKALSSQEQEQEQEQDVCTERLRRVDADDSPTVVNLPLVDGSEFRVSQNRVDGWKPAYPGIDVVTELQKARVWLEANPKKRKANSGILRFAASWLARAQDSGRSYAPGASGSDSGMGRFV